MKYRLMIQLSFDDELEARKLLKKVKEFKVKARPLKDDYFNLHICTHDDPEGGPCQVLEEWHP